MKLYYATGACSLAVHIALHETDLSFDIIAVNLRTGKFDSGEITEINPKGYVPVLDLGTDVLTEVGTILQYLADISPEAKLIPAQGMDRYHTLEWINFISTEIHKGFGPLWFHAPSDYKKKTMDTLENRFDYLNRHLQKGPFLMGKDFTAADAYLFTTLSWCDYLNISLSPWPHLQSYVSRMKERPSVREAMLSEGLHL